MKAGSMEGLIGATMSMQMADTPIRVYKQAERKGDTATMERAMGYAEDMTQQAYDYTDMAKEELRKEMKEEREEQKVQQEEKIEEHREEAKEQREAATVQATDKDTVSISVEGQKVSSANPTPSEPVMDSNSTEPKTYTTDGSIVASGASEPTISVNI